MKTISVLHITDLHFGCHQTTERMSDNKDKRLGIPDRVGGYTWQTTFINKVCNWTKTYGKIDCVVCTGDLIENGSISEEERRDRLENSILFLLKICEAIKLSSDDLLIAPGNHDLNRDNTLAPFADLDDICQKYNISRCATTKITNLCVKDELNIFAINSCMGATEKVEEIESEYFHNFLNEIKREDTKKIYDRIDKCSYQKDLDIPAIGDDKTNELIGQISDLNEFSSIVLLMHHNPIPLANIEIRPYANIIDGGRLISDLLNTGKNIYILHGHTHIENNLCSFIPNSNKDNFISFLGGAQLNGGAGSKAFIAQYFSLNKQIIKTNIYDIKKHGASFTDSFQFSIDDHKSKVDISIQWHKLTIEKTYTFEEIKQQLEYNGSDETLIKNILYLGYKHFKFKKIHIDNYREWEYIYN